MHITLDYWFMFPISIIIATMAMASGVGGATFFAPLFIVVLRLPPTVAIGTGLITEFFGFGSGVWSYYRKRLIDYKLGANLLMATIPAAIVGTILANAFPSDVLKAIVGVGLFGIGASFLRSPDKHEVQQIDAQIQEEYGEIGETTLITADGEEIRYTVCNRNEGRAIGGIGGLFVGMVATGLGELNSYFLMQRCKVPSKVAVATSVFVIAVTVLAASGSHLLRFAQEGGDALDTVFSLVIFTVPGVIIGGQLGPRIATRISQHTLERALGVLFLLIGIITLIEVAAAGQAEAAESAFRQLLDGMWLL